MCTQASATAGIVKATCQPRFAYDALSRLTEGRVVADGSDFIQEVEFDAFGNITEVTTSTFPPRVIDTSTSTNHLTSGSYSHSGSLTGWNFWSYDWNRVEMMKRRSTTGQHWRYVYTAGDERFWTKSLAGGPASDFTLRDLDGRVLRVYEAGESKWSRFTDYVWRGDALLARDFSYTRPEAFHLDHLGTPRLLTNHRAERLAQPNYYPFGEELTVNTQVAERLKFTGHERDTLGSEEVADDLDYMHARFANPITGRFLSVDPAQESAIRGMPQSWNRYAYGMGNPGKYVDPDGRAAETFLDVIGIGYDISELVRDPSWKNAGILVADVGLAAVPFVPGIGAIKLGGKALNAATKAGNVVVLGETMDRVRPIAARLGAATFEGAASSKAELMAKNLEWLKGQVGKGAAIFDIGLHIGRHPGSDFYRVEVAFLQNSGYVRRFSHIEVVQGERVIVWKWILEPK